MKLTLALAVAFAVLLAGCGGATPPSEQSPAQLSEQEVCGGPCDGCIGFNCGRTSGDAGTP